MVDMELGIASYLMLCCCAILWKLWEINRNRKIRGEEVLSQTELAS